LSILLTFHNLRYDIAISGNEQGQTPYMDNRQAHCPYPTRNITISGKSCPPIGGDMTDNFPLIALFGFYFLRIQEENSKR
jgi:hypothetical protein